MTRTAADHKTVIASSAPSVPRLRREPTPARRTLLDGGWWPRSTDPVAELPGLILALDDSRGPVTRLMLTTGDWDSSRPRRLGVEGRVVRLGWFNTQPAGLLTALRGNGDRIDLLVIPPNTTAASAAAAMAVAADPANTLHTPDILTTVTKRAPETHPDPDRTPEAAWESEGGRLLQHAV